MVVAPSFDKQSINLLKQKKNLILLKIPNIKKQIIEYKSTLFGELYKQMIFSNKKFINLVSNLKTSSNLLEDLIFSLKLQNI